MISVNSEDLWSSQKLPESGISCRSSILKEDDDDDAECYVIQILSKIRSQLYSVGHLNVIFSSLRKAFAFHTRYCESKKQIAFSRVSSSSFVNEYETKYNAELNLKYTITPYRGQFLNLDPADYYYRNRIVIDTGRTDTDCIQSVADPFLTAIINTNETGIRSEQQQEEQQEQQQQKESSCYMGEDNHNRQNKNACEILVPVIQTPSRAEKINALYEECLNKENDKDCRGVGDNEQCISNSNNSEQEQNYRAILILSLQKLVKY